jgi:DNA-binding NarL/FixJ family response regulator
VSEPDDGSAPPVRVLVADDQHLIREGIASLLSIETGITVVGMAQGGRDALEKAIALGPDVVLMDVRMPGFDGADATALLRHELPGCRVVMLTTFDDEEYVARALRLGAAGYLLKDLPLRELANAVRLVHAGALRGECGLDCRPARVKAGHSCSFTVECSLARG